MNRLGKNKLIALIVFMAFMTSCVEIKGEVGFSWPSISGGKKGKKGGRRGGGGSGTREFFSQNLEDLETVRIHLWGDVPAPGIYYVPQETTLRTVMGYVGGPPDVSPKNTKISLSRITKQKSKGKTLLGAKHYRLTALDILEEPKWSQERIMDGDVVFIRAIRPSGFNFFEFLRDLLFILGFITTSVSTILVLQKLS